MVAVLNAESAAVGGKTGTWDLQVDGVTAFATTPYKPLYRERELFEVLVVWCGDVVRVVLDQDFAVIFGAAAVLQAVEESADVAVGIAVDSRSQDQAEHGDTLPD